MEINDYKALDPKEVVWAYEQGKKILAEDAVRIAQREEESRQQARDEEMKQKQLQEFLEWRETQPNPIVDYEIEHANKIAAMFEDNQD